MASKAKQSTLKSFFLSTESESKEPPSKTPRVELNLDQNHESEDELSSETESENE